MLLALSKGTTVLDLGVRAAWGTRVLLLTLLLLALGARRSQADQGTTLNIREIFLGRCWDYQHVVNPQQFQSGLKNCSLLWKHFKDAFANRARCDVPMNRYERFAQYAQHPVANDKALFWSGVFPFVYRYTSLGSRYVAIGDTLTGYIVNHLHWCGNADGIDYSTCPSWTDCLDSAERAFWNIASINFASEANGKVYVMFNASGREAFRRDSTFALYELPHLNATRVKSLHVFLIKPITQTFSETCDKGSVASLRHLVEEKGITFNCTENPYDVVYLLCAREPTSTRCKSIELALGVSSTSDRPVMSIGFYLAFCIYLLHFLGIWNY